MKKLFTILLAGLLVLPLVAQEAKPINPEKLKCIRELLVITNQKELGEMVMDSMFSSFQKVLADNGQANAYPPEFWTKAREAFNIEELVELQVPLYDKHYTTEELKELIAFYRTPLGKKVAKVTPTIAIEAAEAGNKWGQEKMRELLRNLRK